MKCHKCTRSFVSAKAVADHQSVHRPGYAPPAQLRSMKAVNEVLTYIDGRIKDGYMGLEGWNEADRLTLADIITKHVPDYHQARRKR
ncbi:MAG TPA: hypothetical protein VF723_11340 [Pyrinomonadaceae bacterium]|jgi:glutathione S-transferase